MGRAYEISVKVSDHNPDNFFPIMEAVNDVFDMGGWTDYDSGIMGTKSDGYLCSGETEQEISERIANVAMEANGAKCHIEVCCTCMEYIPSETYSFDSPEDFA